MSFQIPPKVTTLHPPWNLETSLSALTFRNDDSFELGINITQIKNTMASFFEDWLKDPSPLQTFVFYFHSIIIFLQLVLFHFFGFFEHYITKVLLISGSHITWRNSFTSIVFIIDLEMAPFDTISHRTFT